MIVVPHSMEEGYGIEQTIQRIDVEGDAVFTNLGRFCSLSSWPDHLRQHTICIKALPEDNIYARAQRGEPWRKPITQDDVNQAVNLLRDGQQDAFGRPDFDDEDE
jgi:hypothetical protein